MLGRIWAKIVRRYFKIRLWFYKRKLMRLAKYCRLVDELFRLNMIPRHDRKRFWKAFYKRSAVLDDLLNEINWDEI